MYNPSPPDSGIPLGGVLAYTGFESMPVLLAAGILMIVGSIILRVAMIERNRAMERRH